MRAGDIADQFSIVLESGLAGIAIHQEVPPFNIAKASHLLEKSAVPPCTTNSHVADFNRRIDHHDALDLRRLLGTRDDRPRRRRAAEYRDELAPLHVPPPSSGDGILSTQASTLIGRSEERRVGKECRSRWSPYH